MTPGTPSITPEAEWSSISEWLRGDGLDVVGMEPITGDLSLRRYFRLFLAGGATAVLAWYPEELRPGCHRFLTTSSLLSEAGVPVPTVLVANCTRGWTLLEDAGDRTVHELSDLGRPELEAMFRRASEYIPRIQALPSEVVGSLSPVLGASLLRWELEKTWELFLQPRGLAGGPQVTSALRRALEAVCDALGNGPQVPCHRDFMVRNLMPRGGPGGELLVLDHQDLRLGPPTYDLASLLNDSLFPPLQLEDELVSAALPRAVDLQSYRRTVVQRTLKAIGNYCDFARRGFGRHLPLVRPTLARAWSHLPHLSETRELVSDLHPLWEEYLAGGGEDVPIC